MIVAEGPFTETDSIKPLFKVGENINDDNFKNNNEKVDQIIQYDSNKNSKTKNIDMNTNKSTIGTINYDNRIIKDNLISNEDGPIENIEGSMIKETIVYIKNKMIFHATATDKS